MTWNFYQTVATSVGQQHPVTSHGQCGFARVVSHDQIDDANYHGGKRLELQLAGPVTNRDETVVLDATPEFDLVS